MNQSRWLIIGIAAGVIIIFVIGLFTIERNNRYSVTAPKEPEASANQAAGVVITGTGDLANILLTNQFFSVRTNLVAHIQDTYPSAKTAAIIGTTTVNHDGSVSFSLQVPAANKTLAVTIERLTRGNVEIIIPTDNYNSGVIQVY